MPVGYLLYRQLNDQLNYRRDVEYRLRQGQKEQAIAHHNSAKLKEPLTLRVITKSAQKKVV